jgi:lipopolysaccharide export system permease protein
MPEILVTILPIAFLLSLLYALTNHARHHEITAMRAAGIGLFRIALPYLGVGILLSLAVFAMNELWVPDSMEAADDILAKRTGPKLTEEKLGFYNPAERRWWFIESYDLATADMSHPHVIWIRPDGTRTEILAAGCSYAGGIWIFTNVNLLVYVPGAGGVPQQQEVESLPMPVFKETPEQIRSEIKISRLNNPKAVRKAQLSLREILEYERLHPGDHAKRAMLDTKFHGRLAAAWTCFVVVLIALPFGAASGRRNVFVGVASSIVICFAYFVLLQLTLALGTGGWVPPWLAAWAPNAVFALIGLVLTARER